ncbi:importin subunit alpha [Phlebotomus argentipes]|uniref:importin subunit alpha n=1 Tax=Phlebotomus argentipes TaxID=94469 RepID=UPI0028930705|nr:importin subunit alpha [Phlebotomus argentipes]XP_059613893.1 importin subunit alpha [Phlebotomus argentipes]
MPENDRMNAFKNHAKHETMRLRRQEVTVELRKNKKDDQMMKRRNIELDESLSPQKDAAQLESTLSLDQIVSGLSNPNAKIRFEAVQAARKMLSRERNPPIDIMIAHGIVPKCVELLGSFQEPDTQFEAAWTLTNIASGTTQQTKAVIDAGSIPCFVVLMSSPSTNVAEQAVWALGNIAGDGAEARDIVLEKNVVPAIMHLLSTELSLSCKRNVVWLISNLCRNKPPAVAFDHVRTLLPTVARLLNHDDSQVLSDTCWALSYITDDDNAKIQAVVEAGCVPRLCELLESKEPAIITPALRSVGNIVTGTDSQTDAVIASGAVAKLAKLLRYPKSSIVKEAAWTVSNITAGNPKQIQHIIDAGIIGDMIEVLARGDFKSQKEAAWAITNLTTGATSQQTLHVLNHYDFLKAFSDLLESKDVRVVKVVLQGILNLLIVADKVDGREAMCIKIEEIGGLDKLEALQNHENTEIYQRALTILDTYFADPDAETNTMKPAEQEGAFQFDAGSSGTPNGGFNF